jgi:uncharacterized protein (DUF433 family)
MPANIVMSAFSAEHVSRITGLTGRQLHFWDATGFFKPTYTDLGGGKRPLRVYSFTDVVALRVLHVLRSDYKISLQNLRHVAEELMAYSNKPWSTLKLGVCKGEVVVIDPAIGRGLGARTGQYVFVPLINQIQHVKRAAARLDERDGRHLGKYEQRRNIAHNARVIAGTRIPVKAIERFLEAGYSKAGILAEYPSLRMEDVEAVALRHLTKAVA